MNESVKSHKDLITQTKLLAGKMYYNTLRLFDRNVGLFHKKRISPENIIDYSPISIGIPGQADNNGFYLIDLIDVKIPIMIEVEYKYGKDKQRKEQIDWENFCKSMNVPYFLVRDKNEFLTKELPCRMEKMKQEIIQAVKRNF